MGKYFYKYITRHLKDPDFVVGGDNDVQCANAIKTKIEIE